MTRGRQQSSVRLGTSATPSSASSRLNRVIRGDPFPHITTPSTSTSRPSASNSRADPGADADDDIELVEEESIPLSSLGLGSGILQFCEYANVHNTKKFLAAKLDIKEMSRFIQLVEEWLERVKDEIERRRAAKKEYEMIVDIIKMERIFPHARLASSQQDRLLSGLGLPPAILAFLQLADVMSTNDFAKNNQLRISEVRRAIEEVQQWLASNGGRQDKASATKEYKRIVTLIGMERIYAGLSSQA